jgi:L-aspartate oxidase
MVDPVNYVWLDLRPIPPEQIRYRFPKIIQVCQQWGIDVFRQPIPVAPAAHYWMGGIVTDLKGKTSIPGLYAVGEVASTGVHGANRLASNSLLECLVFSAQLADIELPQVLASPIDQSSSELIQQTQQMELAVQDWSIQLEKLTQLRQELPSLVWQSAGICREQSVLDIAISQVKAWRTEFQQLSLSQYLLHLQSGQSVAILLPQPDLQLRSWAETWNLLDIAYLILKSAAFRTESRGGHYRLDYPQTEPEWQLHTLVQNQNWRKSPLL